LSAGAAGSLTLPGHALALERGVAHTLVRERWLGELSAGTHAVSLGRNADLIGLEWRAPRAARVRVRFRNVDGRVSPWAMASAGQPPIIARHAWAQGRAAPRVAPSYGAVRLAFVHHTDSPNGSTRGEVPAMLRAIYAFHTYVNGWDDIGYNFAIDAFGRIFE